MTGWWESVCKCMIFFFPPLIVQNIKVDVKKVVSPVKSEAKPDMNFTYKT